MTGPFDSFEDYDFRHWVGIQAALGDDFSIHRLFGLRARNGLNCWFDARDTRNELAGYVSDLDIARLRIDGAAAAAASAQLLGLQCRYALIAGSIREVAARHLPALAVRYVRSGLWPREQALTWARLSPDPAQALATVREALRDEPGEGQGELAQLAISTGAAILDSDNRVLAVADLAGDLPPHVIRDALAIVAREANEGSRLGGLRRIVGRLPGRLRDEALEIAKAFRDPLIRAQAIISVAEALDEPARTVEIDAVLDSLRSGDRPRPHPVSDNWRAVARALPLDRVREFLDSLIEDEESIPWPVVTECLSRLAETDPDWVLAQLEGAPPWVLNEALETVALALARRGRHAEAARELDRISSSVLDMPMYAATIAQLLLLAPADQREALLSVFSRRSAGAQVAVLKVLVSGSAPAELLQLLVARAHKGEDSLELLSAIAPFLTPSEIDGLLDEAIAGQDTRSLIAHVAPYFSLTQVRRALSSSADAPLHDAFKALVVRLSAIGEHEEAVRQVQQRTDIAEFDRAAILAELVPHIPDTMLGVVKACSRPAGLARDRALARCALVPWLAANTVDEIVEDVLRLKPSHRIEVLADLVEHITPNRLLAIGEAVAHAVDDFLRTARYDRYVVECGFRALSVVLSRVASSELEERALALARSDRLSATGHILMLGQLASVGGDFSHVVRALVLAFEIAGDHPDLVETLAGGLSSAHKEALSAVLQQDVSRRPAAFAVALPFLDAAARADARRRFEDVNGAGQLATAAARLKPAFKAALAAALAGDTPLRPDVEAAFDDIAHLPAAKRAATIAEIAAWLDSTQIERALVYLQEDGRGRTPALAALVQRAAVLGDLARIEEIISCVGNEFELNDLIRDAAKHLPAAALPFALARAEHSDSAIGALAVRAARLGEGELLMSALNRMTWADNMDAIEEVYRSAPEHLLEALIARADSERPSDRATALAEVVPRVADDRRQALLEQVIRDSFSLRVGLNPRRLRILKALEKELSQLPTPALARLWAEAMRGGTAWSREETMVDIRGFAPPLVAQFGPLVAFELDDAIAVAGRDEWP